MRASRGLSARESRAQCERVAVAAWASVAAFGVWAGAAGLAGDVAARAHVGGLAVLGLGAAVGPVEWGGIVGRVDGGLGRGGRGVLGLLGVGRDGLGHGEPPRSMEGGSGAQR